ncbi:ABC transporter substrate-binding protein [Pollutimonas thiosulfatoxidans]|uniref:Branched-chain amino acid ABC transporter substrate-binding protein n=1 Tax=Pollutimonas thiosulfatoxidans TaxID=2028345 RepID=A0A410GEN5_9BURK|nr:ABC transporter substrate-binding protein [Pollutimonas thiosulfatoxidans]QAA94748.1 branched-chain amino acid ABC transporter substrate-binding protein [Pollutimonas thiosulfatoxidans]
MQRRTFLKRTAATAAMMSGPWIGGRAFAKEKATIAGTVSMSGPFASVGTPVDVGNRLAVEVFGQGLPVELGYITLDDQSDPGKAVRSVQEAHAQGVRHYAGTSNSASALAISKELEKSGGIYTNQAGADSMTGTDCARSTFRWPAGTYGAVEQSVRPLIEQMPDAKRWYTITGQYVFGESLLQSTKSVLAEMGCEHIGNSYHSLSEKEFSGYIANAMAAQPDVLCISNFGNQTMDVIRTAVSFGMKRNTTIIVPWSTGLDQFRALGSDVIEGLYFGTQYWHDLKTPGNERLLKAYSQKHNDRPIHSFATGYATIQMLAEAMKKAGTADYREMIKAMEGLEYEGISGVEKVRAGDHQVLKDCYLMKGKARSAMKDEFDFAEILSSGKSFLPVEKTGCKLAST